MFLDDSDFRKAKRALLISSSIALLLGLANINLHEIDFAIVKFSFDNSTVINLFVIAVVIYQSIVLYNRARNYFSSKQLEVNKRNEEIFRSGHTPQDFELAHESIKKNVEEVEARLNATIDNANIKPRPNFDWKKPEDIETSTIIGDETISTFLEICANARLLQSRKEVLEKIIKDEKVVYSVNIYDKILDMYFPLVYAISSCIILSIALCRAFS